MKHAFKIGFLLVGLGFLFWWGWSGNFIFNPESPFRYNSSDNYYLFSIGGKNIGYARRVVEADTPDAGMKIIEDSLINLDIPGLSGDIRLRSEVLYGPDGRPLEASFTVPGFSLAKAEAKIDKGFLDFTVNLGPLSRKIEKPIPKDGPILISAVGPWLSRQSEVPLGKVLFMRLFDPTKMEFVSAELIINDVSEASDEIQLFQISLSFPGGVSNEWVDANGILVKQRLANIEAGLDIIEQEDPTIATAEQSLQQEPSDLMEGLALKIPEMLPGFFSNLPIDSLLGGNKS
jgi:hypothetical protein